MKLTMKQSCQQRWTSSMTWVSLFVISFLLLLRNGSSFVPRKQRTLTRSSQHTTTASFGLKASAFEDSFEFLTNKLISNNNELLSTPSSSVGASASSTGAPSLVDTFQATAMNIMEQLKLLFSFDGIDFDFKINDVVNDEMITEVSMKIQTIVEQVINMLPPEIKVVISQITTTITSQLTSSVGEDNLSSFLVPAIAAGGTFIVLGIFGSIISTVTNSNDGSIPSKPYPDSKYDPIAAKAYFDRKPLEALGRAIQIMVASLGFGLSLLKDKIDNKWDENASQRGMELAQLLTKLGPTYIKIGQSLSIRTDILSPPYVRGLASLQDQVAPFESSKAKEILQDDWDTLNSYSSIWDDSSILNSISTKEPVAAASLGQVYKATLKKKKNFNMNDKKSNDDDPYEGKDTIEVAIKIQRPNIMNQIALDMYLLREVAAFVKPVFNLNTDTIGTVDAWGKGFVDELDYIQEAKNGKQFMEKIQTTPLKDVVLSPNVIDELSTSKVLVTEWVDGERLDKSSQEDVTVLCSIAMNTYLTMLLELGVLHCDPHPGNLLRTPDGRLCILDWGMVTQLPPDLQLAMIEHMAHLTSSDYAEVPRDLLLLGFIPESEADKIEDSGVVEVLADIYGAWTAGGGVAGIDVNKVVSQMQDLTATRGNIFQIPPYFAYIAKSFSVLEGIGLSNDAKYSIINECLPYVSQRLLSGQSDMGPALSTFVFGPEKGNLDTRIVDYDRVEQLVTGFGNYSTSASGALLGSATSSDGDGDSTAALSTTQVLESVADQVLSIVLTEESTPVQEILLEQLAKIVTSNTRNVWTTLRERSGTLPSGRSVLGTIVDPLGLFRTSPLVRMDEVDEKTVDTTRKLLLLAQSQASVAASSDNKNANSLLDVSNLTPIEIRQLSLILIRKVWDRRLGLVKTGSRFATKLLQLTADKLEKGGLGDNTNRFEQQQQQQDDDDESTTSSPETSTFAPSTAAPSTTTTTPMATTVGTSRRATSARLSQARDRLNQLLVDERD